MHTLTKKGAPVSLSYSLPSYLRNYKLAVCAWSNQPFRVEWLTTPTVRRGSIEWSDWSAHCFTSWCNHQ